MTRETDRDLPLPLGEAELDALFGAARAARPAPLGGDFLARLIADAETARRPAARPGLWARARAALADLGGLPGLASVTAAGVAGVWIGFAQPATGGGVSALFWEGAAGVSPAVALFLEETTPFDDFDSDE